jgi:beta-N-acetylhexosaminidase
MRLLARILGGLLLAAVVLLVVLVASQVRSPYLAVWREEALIGLPVLGAAVMVLGVGLWRGGSRLWALLALAGLVIAALPPVLEWRFREQRAWVLSEAPQHKLERWSRHIVLGYTSFDEIREVLERMELAGIYVTARNVQDRSVEEVRHEIKRLQAIQRARRRPPLLVAADQEGGPVSRLTPPLDQVAGLGQVACSPDWRGAVRAYAESKARALRRLGVTMNLAPVVDLKLGTERTIDLHTNLDERAIAAAPGRVAEVAELYSRTLWEGGVLATAKHFPGLGRVAQDTHHFTGQLDVPPRELAIADWVPFERLARAKHPVAIMVAHVVATRVDPKRVATVSEPLVDGVLRRKLGHRGLVITDDLCMSPIVYSKGGMAARVVEAISAGVDLALISFDPDQLYPLMAELTRLDRVPEQALAKSRARLRALRGRLAGLITPKRRLH